VMYQSTMKEEHRMDTTKKKIKPTLSIRMNFLIVLAQQPLFRLLGAILVLLITDMKPVYGLIAALVWVSWVYMGYNIHDGRHIFF
jgi:hypothetical protein